MESALSGSWTCRDDPATATLDLPGGYRDPDGGLHLEAALRPITGREEEFLAAHLGLTPIPGLVTRLLAGCLGRLGPFEPVTPQMVRDLLVVDRDYLLLKLRQLTFGDQVRAILVCPACGQKMDIDFELARVPIEARRPAGSTETIELSPAAAYTGADGKTHRLVEFRLPTGRDQESLAVVPGIDEARAITTLLARCLLRVGDVTSVDESVAAGLSVVARREIEDGMERVAPRVDLDMDVTCPECNHGFVQPFDFSRLFFAEVKLRREQLYREVHVLALHYHWPESEILALTRAKRRTYLELVQAEARRPGAFMES